VQRQRAGLAELSIADDEQAVDRVEVTAVETDGFSNPHPGYGQQGHQSPIGRYSVWRAQCAGRFEQGGNVLFRIEVGRGPACSPRQ
jgi:hypothetical protein